MNIGDWSHTIAKINKHEFLEKDNKKYLKLTYTVGSCNWAGEKAVSFEHDNVLVVGVVAFADNTVDCEDSEKPESRTTLLEMKKEFPKKISYIFK